MSAARAQVLALLVGCGLAVGFGVGCSTQKSVSVDFSETPRDFLGKDYIRVYDRWTRHEQVLIDEDVALEVWATYKSWEYRQAYVQKYVEIYGLSEDDQKTLHAAQQETTHAAYEFHVTAQSSNYKWNDLEKTNSAWRVTLIDALGHELAPESVKVLKLPDAYETTFFPSKTPFTKTYAIRFAVPADAAGFAGVKTGALTLRFTSPIGRVELSWRSG